jgi:subfamily B ATP-binding cassette protein MsbA
MSATAPTRLSAFATYRRLLGYAAGHWPVALVALVGMVFDAGVAGAFTRLIQPMLDDLFIKRDPVMTFWMPIVIVVLFFVRGLATFASDFGMARIGRGVVRQLRDEVFARYLTLPTAWFDREPSGQTVARLAYTVEQVAQATTDAVKVLVLDSLTAFFLFAVMLYNSAELTALLAISAPLIAIVVWTVGRRYRRINRRIQDSVGTVVGIVGEVANAQREVKVYSGETSERERFAAANEHNRRLNLKVAATNALSTSLVQLVAASALAAIIFFATQPGMLRKMTPGSFMSLISAMLLMLPSLKRLTTVQALMQRGVAAAQDLFAVLDTPGEADSGKHAIARCRGELELRDVTLRYAGRAQPALHGVTLRCAPGTVTALVGRSGSGKSSLVNLIPRFYEPSAGEIRLDGRPLADYTLASLRAQIAWVGQEVVVFADTIGRNIAYGGLAGAPREAVVAAARAANALDFIEALPHGLDSEAGEGGALLSGGQRQRIAIARALLKDAPILILDEATSALDSESERQIQDALKGLMRDRTVLVIAHRLSTVEHADQIVVLDAGRVVESGSHAELLARGGHYAALYKMQFRDGGS